MAKGENPAKRSRRYAKELKAKRNSLTGERLTANQASFRMGVLNERKWSSRIFKHNNAKRRKK